MKNELTTKASRIISDVSVKLKKHSPEILMTVGIIGTIVGTVMACKATTKATEILKIKDIAMDQIRQASEEFGEDDYSIEDCKKDTTLIYTKTGLDLIKIYAPAVGVMMLSLTAIIAGHTVLKKRNVAVMTAYGIIDRSFKKYRENVIEKFGESVDKELRYNIKKETIKTKDENGKNIKETVDVIDTDDVKKYSEYARFFDPMSEDWEKDAEYNLMFLRRQQDYMNERLKAKGHLFLNEVYDALDIARTKAGQVVGWIYDPENNKSVGDNYVDFGIYNLSDETKRRFVNGLERSILLDFNVDGIIYDRI